MAIDWKDADGIVTNVEVVWQKGRPGYVIAFTYTVDGVPYSGSFSTWTEYTQGDSIAVRYELSNPHSNNFVRREKIKNWIAYSIFAVFVGIALIILCATVFLK